MAIDIHNLIAAINPDIYCDPSVKDEVKKIAKKEGFLKAAEKAKPKESNFIDHEQLALKNPFKSPALKDPVEKHALMYDAFGESLEPLYFWILDFLGAEYKKIDKIVDNFISWFSSFRRNGGSSNEDARGSNENLRYRQ